MKYDVFFIEYDESNSKQNWDRLLQFHNDARLITNIKGIAEAHMLCNKLSTTERFWTVDADNWLIQKLEIEGQYQEDLIFFNAEDSISGYVSTIGGVKLWKKDSIIHETMAKGDFCKNATKTSLTITKTMSIHRYDNTPFEAWRHTFRHMVKCYSGIIGKEVLDLNVSLVEKHKHLNTHSYRGYLDAKEYIEECAGDFSKINLINDYDWLKSKCPKEMQSPLS